MQITRFVSAIVLCRRSLLSAFPLAFPVFASHPQSAVSKRALDRETAFNNKMPEYWNRETSKRRSVQESAPIVKEARIVSLSDPNNAACSAIHSGVLSDGATLLGVGMYAEDFDLEALSSKKPNVIFVGHGMARKPLAQLLEALPTIEWVHTWSAGIDSITSDTLATSNVILTNAKGVYSSTLAEYTMMACSFFAKDLPRLMRQKQAKNWEKYNVLELRGSTLGVIGLGDIGRACARLAHAYGMNVIALRRNPTLSEDDPYCNKIYGSDPESLNRLMSESDYILVATPLTDKTRNLVSAQALSHAKKDAVLINVGRGPIVDENALIASLKSGRLKGAALDVFTQEPLPLDNELWDLDNVLLSPHNMDQTATFLEESSDFFLTENLPRFVRGQQLLNPVDKVAGY